MFEWIWQHWPYLLIALGGGLAIVGGVAAAVNQGRFERDTREQLAETVASITGGDTYCLLRPIYDGKNPPHVWNLYLRNPGPRTAYDVTVNVEELTRRAQIVAREFGDTGRITQESLSDTTKSEDVGNLVANTGFLEFMTVTLPTDGTTRGGCPISS